MNKVVEILWDRCSKILEIQEHKIKKKGIGFTILGYFFFFSFIWVGWLIGLSFWPSHIENPMLFYFLGAFSLHVGVQFLSFLLYLPGYLSWIPFYEKYKINRRSNWPWQRKNWPIVKEKTIFNLVINQFFIYPLIVSSSSLIGLRQRFTDFPSYQEVLIQVLIVYFIEDFFFYWAHRLFHIFPYLYKMHKIHHQYDKIYTFATQYFHPLDFALGNVMPSALGFIVLGGRAHVFTFFFWIFWKVMISTEGHSGYQFPWSPMRVIPLVSGPSFHDHHHSHNIGNYSGSCYFWDLVFGTSKSYWQLQLKSS